MDDITLLHTDTDKSVNPVLPKGVDKTVQEIQEILAQQESRRVSAFEATKLEREAKRNWDIFYKRNETRFFKDRHWTLREFQEILDWNKNDTNIDNTKLRTPILLEVGCGCGNFIIPLLQEIPSLMVYACDFSPRAVNLVKSHPQYDESRIKAFATDITEDNCFEVLHSTEFQFDENEGIAKKTADVEKQNVSVPRNFVKVDFVSLVFVLSAISPSKHPQVIKNIANTMKSGGIVFFRDYGRYDMAQLRFKSGNKISDNFYVRRDGTRAYYFEPEEVETLFTESDHFKKINCEFVHRRTVNIKESVNQKSVHFY